MIRAMPDLVPFGCRMAAVAWSGPRSKPMPGDSREGPMVGTGFLRSMLKRMARMPMTRKTSARKLKQHVQQRPQ